MGSAGENKSSGVARRVGKALAKSPLWGVLLGGAIGLVGSYTVSHSNSDSAARTLLKSQRQTIYSQFLDDSERLYFDWSYDVGGYNLTRPPQEDLLLNKVYADVASIELVCSMRTELLALPIERQAQQLENLLAAHADPTGRVISDQGEITRAINDFAAGRRNLITSMRLDIQKP